MSKLAGENFLLSQLVSNLGVRVWERGESEKSPGQPAEALLKKGALPPCILRV